VVAGTENCEKDQAMKEFDLGVSRKQRLVNELEGRMENRVLRKTSYSELYIRERNWVDVRVRRLVNDQVWLRAFYPIWLCVRDALGLR